MRTTISIDDDVLAFAKDKAQRHHKSIGEVISELARQALRPATTGKTRNGIKLLALRPDATPVTLELVNRLRDELP